MSDNKVVKFKKPFQSRIGTIIFCVICIYLIIIIFSFFTQKHIKTYEVISGSLASYYEYQGLALRKEKIITSKSSGYITYFATENTKVGAKSLVYSLSQDENPFDTIKKNSLKDDILSEEKKGELLEVLDDYSFAYDDLDFYEVYGFKDAIDTIIMESIANMNNAGKFIKGMSAYFAFEPGIVQYTVDGLEEVDVDSFSDDDVHAKNYKVNNLKKNTFVVKNTPVYKVITDENWQILAEIDAECIDKLEGLQYVNVTIKDDGYTADFPFSIIDRNGHSYILIELNQGVIRYAKKRFIDFEINLDLTKGYKIPNSAISKVMFWKIPTSYITEGGNSNSKGVLVVSTDKKGKETTSFKKLGIYKTEGDYVYIHDKSISNGSVILKPSSTERMTINEGKNYSCVYCVNKGYSILRMVEVETCNEDYSIISTSTAFGLNAYDHILLDFSMMDEGEFVH